MQQPNISWDQWGTPTITAENWPSAIFDLGYAQAYLHPNLLLAAMARAQGRAAEILGPHSGKPDGGLTKQPEGVDYLRSDRFAWQLDFAQLGRDYWDQQDSEMAAQITAFSEGINACRKDHPDRFDVRFNALGEITPQMVTAQMSQIVVGFMVAYRIPTVAQWLGGAGSVEPSWGDFAGGGSNACVIGPSKSEQGHPMLVCNPHTQWDVDLNTFMESHINVGTESYVGASLLGWPGMMMGCSAHLGYAGTVNTQSSLTFYQVAVQDDQFNIDAQPHVVTRKTHHIKCLEADGTFSLHAQDQCWSPAHQAFSMAERGAGDAQELLLMAFAGRSRGQLLRQFFDMLTARSLSEFKQATKHHQLPMFNILFAGRDESDNQGHIQYSFHSLPPQRKKGEWADWWHVLDGHQSQNITSGLVPFEDLFVHHDAASGWYQNCNDSPYSCTLPSPFKAQDYAPWLSPVITNFRAQSYSRLLLEQEKFDFDAFVTAKFSTRVELAGRLIPQITAAVAQLDQHEQLPLLQQACEVLQQWDQLSLPESRGIYLFLQWLLHQDLQDTAASPIFADQWDADLAADPEAWFDSLSTPNKLLSATETVRALAEAVQLIVSQGHDLDVAWQDAVTLKHGEYQVPAIGAPGDPLGVVAAIPLTPVSLRPVLKTGKLLANRIENEGGETFVMAVQFTPEGATGGTFVSYGNSSIYQHKNNGDQIQLLSKRQLKPFTLTKHTL